MTSRAISPLYLPDRDVARMLGHDVDWLRKNAAFLEQTTGFPKVDVAVGLRHREAVEVWARKRNMRSVPGQDERLTDTNRENLDAL